VALTLAWTVDERHDPPLLLAEDTLLIGRRIGTEQAAAHIAVAEALARRLAGDPAAALEVIGDAQARFASIGDGYGHAYAAAQRGHTLRWVGDFDAADDALAESEKLRRELRDQRAVAMSLAGRALAAAGAGAAELARQRGREAVSMMERSGDNPGVALTATTLGTIQLILGDEPQALRWFTQAAQLPDVPGGHRAYGWVKLVQALLLAHAGRAADAAAAADVAEASFARLGEQRGLAAVQSARKERLPSVLVNDTSEED
jgi:hypothetical protein